MNKPIIGSTPVNTWLISNGNICKGCNSIIKKGFPYLEEDYVDECHNYCLPCAVKFDRKLTSIGY